MAFFSAAVIEIQFLSLNVSFLAMFLSFHYKYRQFISGIYTSDLCASYSCCSVGAGVDQYIDFFSTKRVRTPHHHNQRVP